MSLTDEARDVGCTECEICGGEVYGQGKYCKPCTTNSVAPGTKLNDDELNLTLPVDAPHEHGELMLKARGYDPDEWVEVNLIVNQWDSQVKGGAVVTLHQTKITYKRKVPIEETPIGQFIAWVDEKAPVEFVPLPTVKGTKQRKKVYVAIGDHQAPYVDRGLHELALEMMSDLNPDGIIYMGDGPDFDSISRHRKKQGTDFISNVQQGLDSMHTILGEMVEASGAQDNYYLIGNHDVRIETVVTDKVPDLFGVTRANSPDEFPALSIPNLLRLGELGYQVVTDSKGDYPHGRVVISEGNEDVPPLVASHGWIARKGAGQSARHSIDNLNASIIVGHTHRLAVTSVTRWHEGPGGQSPMIYTAAESGAMCDGEGLGYSKYPDWQPGFLVVDVHPNNDYEVSMVTKRGNALKWGGMMWTRTAKGVKRSP